MNKEKQIINNCRKGIITVIRDKDNEYMSFSNHKDYNGNYRRSYSRVSIEEAKQFIGEGEGFSEKEMKKYSKEYKWEIVKVYRDDVEPFKVGDKVRILPSIENIDIWTIVKEYYPRMKGEIMSVSSDMKGFQYCVWSENKVRFYYIGHQYLAPLCDEVEEEVIKIGNKNYSRRVVEEVLKNIKPLQIEKN